MFLKNDWWLIDVELHSDINKISKNESDLWSNIIERIHRLKDSCGDLCDTEKNIKEGEFLGTVESNVGMIWKKDPKNTHIWSLLDKLQEINEIVARLWG